MSPTVTTVLMLVTSVAGMLGWFFAWLSRGEAGKQREAAEIATAGEVAAKAVALEASQATVTANSLRADAAKRADQLQLQLDAERKSKQTLVDALAKAGHPVGAPLVDAAVDRLYPDGDQGGAGAGSDPGRDSAALPGQPADASSAPPKG